MTIIPELEKARGTFRCNRSAYTPEDDDTIFRYYGKVETNLIRKYIDTKKHSGRGCIRNRFNRLKKTGYKLADSLPAEDPKQKTVLSGEKMPEASTKKKRGNKYGIPPELFSTDKKKYQRLWGRCRDWGITYDEALKFEGKTIHGLKRLKKVAAKKETPQAVEKIQPAPSSNEAKPLAEAITPSNEAIEAPPDPFRIGTSVRYTGTDPRISGTGQVKRAPQKSDEVLVQFSNAVEWVKREHLTVVPV
jgi:hypothetical protein